MIRAIIFLQRASCGEALELDPERMLLGYVASDESPTTLEKMGCSHDFLASDTDNDKSRLAMVNDFCVLVLETQAQG